MSEKTKNSSETLIKVPSGGLFLVTGILLILLSTGAFILSAYLDSKGSHAFTAPGVIIGIVFLILFFIVITGLFSLAPNQSAVLALFGDYRGTVRQTGLLWTNPLYSKKKVSLRARNLNGDKLKVNDQVGNPIEIAAVVVWKVSDTFKASYEVENYESFVKIQTESAVRHIAYLYPYDFTDDDSQGISLRGNTEEVAEALKSELNNRVAAAGISVIESRISHLAYAPEIAAAMLQRQQATAVISARQRIVEGAVGMVQMAIEQLAKNGVVELDEERKASMVSNLMVVLCSEKGASPVVNAGTLYQ